MYLDYYGLEEQPFRLTPDSRFLYLSKGHARAKSYMDYTVFNHEAFVVITGKVGSGKTTLIQELISKLDERVVVAKIFQTQLNEVELLQSILIEFNINPFNKEKVELLDMLNMYLVQQFTLNRQVVLIVDDAQNLGSSALEEIRLLSGVETQREKILNVILVGQPTLRETLNTVEMEQLAQRVRFSFHLEELSKNETKEYIAHRLKVAGATNTELFQKKAILLIYKYTGGIPRLINILCDTSMICAFTDKRKTITVDDINNAVDELQWCPYKERVHNQGENKQVEDNISRLPLNRVSKKINSIEEHLEKLTRQLEEQIGHEYQETDSK